MIFGINTTRDISKSSRIKLGITILKYHSWYLWQISLQIMLLPIQKLFLLDWRSNFSSSRGGNTMMSAFTWTCSTLYFRLWFNMIFLKKKILGILTIFFIGHYILGVKVCFSKIKMSKYNYCATIVMETSWYYCLHWSGRYLPYLDPPYINPPFDLCVWGLGGSGGGFLDSEVELVIFPKSRSRSAFNLGGPAPNGRRDGDSNGTTLDLVFTTAPSHGFRGADIP